MSMFQVGDQVVDLVAIGDYWPSQQGEVVRVDGSRIKVSYFSGETRWRKDISLALETAREVGARRPPPTGNPRVDPGYTACIAVTFHRWDTDHGHSIPETFFVEFVNRDSFEGFMRTQRKMIEEIVPGAD